MNQRQQLQPSFARKRPKLWKWGSTNSHVIGSSPRASKNQQSVKLLAAEEAGTRMENQGRKPSPLTVAFIVSERRIRTIVAGFETSGIA
jgi:hypothetical protein